MPHSFEGYGLLFQWRTKQIRTYLPIILVLQTVLSVGIVYGLAFLLPNIDSTSALFLCTGAPTLSLLLMGLTIVPQELIQTKRTGGYDYMRTFPVPRLAFLAAEISVWLLAQLPATALALIVAALRFHFALNISPLVVPVVLLVGATSAAVGYAIALALPVELAQNLASFTSIALLLFSPINFPMSRLPNVLQVVHHVLPVGYMADLMRWTLTGVHDESVLTGSLVVTAWCLASLIVCQRVAVARG
jgi:ABC-2 type transport system permease protein